MRWQATIVVQTLTILSLSLSILLFESRKQWFTALVLTELMILIFFFRSNKHWHEKEPQAEAFNEKMKLVFQLTDQKHFIHYNQTFIWCDLLCVRVTCVSRSFGVLVCACKYIIHACVCYCLLLQHQDTVYDIFPSFVAEQAASLGLCDSVPHPSQL